MKIRNNCSRAVTVEVLRPDEFKTRPRRTQAEVLELLVQQKVAQVLADRDELIFEPWFRTRQVAHEIRRLQAVPERKKWALYFERHGCLVCESRDRSHSSKGLCQPCHARVFIRLKTILSELMNERNCE